VGLVPNTNRKATIRNVRRFFFEDENHDSPYQKICRNALSDGVKSPLMDLTGIRGSGRGNAVQSMMTYYAECTKAKEAVAVSIKSCKAISRDILNLRYVGGLFVWQVKERMNRNYGNTTYSEADQQACVEFAEACDKIAIRMNVDPDVLPIFEELNEK